MFRLFLFTIVATAFCYGTTSEMEITGKLTWTDKKPFDASWKIFIELLDTSVKDKAAAVIVKTIVTDAKAWPIMYKLKYNPTLIKPDHTYSLFAHIHGSNDHLLFTNYANTPIVFTPGKAPMLDIPLTYVEKLHDKSCVPMQCPKPKKCQYGWQKKNGCEICKCYDPCTYKKCAPKEKCFVDKKEDGTWGARCETAPIKRAEDLKETQRTKEDCKLKAEVGRCRGSHPRYFYNTETKMCELFKFGGCKGNNNNFENKEECEKLCKA